MCTESHIERVVLRWFGLYKWLQGIVTSVVKKRDLAIIFIAHEALYETWRKTMWSILSKRSHALVMFSNLQFRVVSRIRGEWKWKTEANFIRFFCTSRSIFIAIT